jgi:TIR domain
MTEITASGLRNAAIVTALIVFICALTGAALGSADYRRKSKPVRVGGLTGASLGASIALIVVGLLDIAANNAGGNNAVGTLFGIAATGLGLLILALLRFFSVQPDDASTGRSRLARITGQFRQVRASRRDRVSKPISNEARPTAGNIFISYRRDDSADVTGRIFDRLVQHFGRESIFKDVDSIPFGVDFRVHLRQMVEQCSTVLVIVGDRWLTVVDETGQRRIEDMGDFVRIEIEAALKRGIPVIPLLVKGAVMPRENDLPADLKEFAYRNGTAIRHDPDFHPDMDRLINSLEQSLE